MHPSFVVLGLQGDPMRPRSVWGKPKLTYVCLALGKGESKAEKQKSGKWLLGAEFGLEF